MNSAQNKMRTNGMFLRNFDSKRYQELQAQKQKILEKQQELLRIKEKKEKKEAKRKKKSKEIVEESSSFAVIPESETENTDEVSDSTEGVATSENESIDVTSESEGADSAHLNTASVDIPDGAIPTDVVNEPKEQLKSKCDTVTKTEGSKIENVASKIENVAKEGNVNKNKQGKSKDTNGVVKFEEPLEKKLGIAGKTSQQTNVKPEKEYAIIAKLNKEAILRETELVVKKSETLFAGLNGDIPTEDDAKVKKSKTKSKEQKKTNTNESLKSNIEAYAIVDLDVTMSLVNEVNDINANKETVPEVTETDKTLTNTIQNDSDEMRSLFIDNKDNTYIRNQNYMSRSAGYNGDIDTSTSSIEPDVDVAVNQYLAAKFIMNNKERLVITEEQLSSLQYVGSSSSG